MRPKHGLLSPDRLEDRLAPSITSAAPNVTFDLRDEPERELNILNVAVSEGKLRFELNGVANPTTFGVGDVKGLTILGRDGADVIALKGPFGAFPVSGSAGGGKDVLDLSGLAGGTISVSGENRVTFRVEGRDNTFEGVETLKAVGKGVLLAKGGFLGGDLAADSVFVLPGGKVVGVIASPVLDLHEFDGVRTVLGGLGTEKGFKGVAVTEPDGEFRFDQTTTINGSTAGSFAGSLRSEWEGEASWAFGEEGGPAIVYRAGGREFVATNVLEGIGGSGRDTFEIRPSKVHALTFDGGAPDTAPGDVFVFVRPPESPEPTFTPTGEGAGVWSLDGFESITVRGMESGENPGTAPAFSEARPPAGRVGVAYEFRFTLTAGAPAAFSLVGDGGLPPGLTLTDGGLLHGTPTEAGEYRFTVRATNDTGSADVLIELLIRPAEETGTAPLIAERAPPAGRVGVAYEFRFTLTRGAAAVFSLVGDGDLPPGLTLTDGGVLRGTPTEPGEYRFRLRAENDSGSHERTFELTIRPAETDEGTAPVIAERAPPAGRVGVAYEFRIALVEGAPAVFSLVGDSRLPPGLTLTDGGVIRGTPTEPGEYRFTIRAANEAGIGERSFVINVRPAETEEGTAPVIAERQPPAGRVGVAYEFRFTLTRGAAAVFSLVGDGDLPPGLTLTDGGVLRGTPTERGEYRFTVRATNEFGVGERTFVVNIRPAESAPGVQRVVVTGPDSVLAVYEFSDGKASVVGSFNPFPDIDTGIRAASGDVNGDDIADVIAGTGPGTAGVVRVLDSAGAELFSSTAFELSFTGGVFLAAGDVDGDGLADFAVSPDRGGGGRVRIFSGSDFHQIADIFGIDDLNFRGGARVAIGDINGDGFGDVFVGAGFGGGPRVAIYDGASLAAGLTVKLMPDFFAFNGADAQRLRNGVFLAAGDLDGDGMADLAFGGGPGGAPRVFVLGGAALLANVTDAQTNPLGNFFVSGDDASRGGVRLTVKDADGDDRGDLLVGSGEEQTGSVRVYNGVGFAPGGGEPSSSELDPSFGDGTLTSGLFVG